MQNLWYNLRNTWTPLSFRYSWGIISGPIIFSFHMPLFFFINGLTQKEIVNKMHFIQRKVKTLFLPHCAIRTKIFGAMEFLTSNDN